MRLTKTQVESMISKIKDSASKVIIDYKKEWLDSYIPSEDYKEYKKAIIAYNRAVKRVRKYHEDTWNAPYTIPLDIKLEQFLNTEYAKTQHYKNTPVFNFDSLFDDLILSNISGNDVNEIIANALITYRK